MALNEFTTSLDDTEEIEITVRGRESGREITNPVWFVREGDRLYLLPVRGSDSDWYKNVLDTPAIRLTANGRSRTAQARPITDPAKVREIADKFRAKYGADQVKKYYSKLDVAAEVPLAPS
jgi:deazaflavin-dependent oxidoreductase (nitroreductase family)